MTGAGGSEDKEGYGDIGKGSRREPRVGFLSVCVTNTGNVVGAENRSGREQFLSGSRWTRMGELGFSRCVGVSFYI